MRKVFLALALICNLFLPTAKASSPLISFSADIWADNWFSMYVNGKLVGQDSVPITTTKSFNKETITFSASYPLTIAFVAKDYVENASGLEYIGTSNQQIGDGGFSAQIIEKGSQRIVAVTDKSWKSLVVAKAPLNPECVTSKNPLSSCRFYETKFPTNWNQASFKDASWSYATEFTRDAVGVKGGYLEIAWDPSASLIWSKDLKLDNTILLRKIVNAPTTRTLAQMTFSMDSAMNSTLPREVTCDGEGKMPSFNWSGIPAGTKSLAITMETIPGPPRPGESISGNHFSLVAYNIDPKSTSLTGAIFGTNFQKKSGYAPPCSQGPGLKTYTVTLFALNTFLDANVILDGAGLQAQATSYLVSKLAIDYGYTRI